MSAEGWGPCAAPGGPGTGGPLSVAGPSGRPPKIASKTRRRVSMWSLLATRVASAHRYRPETVTGRATVTALANRSHRPGSAGTPAVRSAAPNLAATRARSSPGTGTPVSGFIGRGQRREPGRAHGLQVFGVLEHRTGGPARCGTVEA